MLGFLDFDRGRSFFAVYDIESDRVAFPQLVKSDSIKLVGVKKQVFLAVFLADKTEVFFSHQFFDCSLHNECRNKVN